MPRGFGTWSTICSVPLSRDLCGTFSSPSSLIAHVAFSESPLGSSTLPRHFHSLPRTTNHTSCSNLALYSVHLAVHKPGAPSNLSGNLTLWELPQMPLIVFKPYLPASVPNILWACRSCERWGVICKQSHRRGVSRGPTASLAADG